MLVLKLWYLVLIVLALHALSLRLRKKLRARRIASSRKATWPPAVLSPGWITYYVTLGRARANGTSPIPTTTSPRSSSTPARGRQPVRIPEQRTRLPRMTWEPTLRGWYETPTPEEPEAGLPAGGEAASHEVPEYSHIPEQRVRPE